jgi:hypothetical protein
MHLGMGKASEYVRCGLVKTIDMRCHTMLVSHTEDRTMETLNYLGMDEFTASYLESALWSSTDDDGTPLDAAKYSDTELAPETVARFKADCDKFRADNAEALAQASEYQSETHLAHDFWLTRNGHGAGFWDGDYPKELGERLTEASKLFGECDLYIGDDGLVYAA